MITMLLGGLWHGAGWTFVVWGALHGVYLVINHAWRRAAKKIAWGQTRGAAGAGWLITFLAVIVGWVFFRSHSFTQAFVMLKGMTGLQGLGLPSKLSPVLAHVGVHNSSLFAVLPGELSWSTPLPYLVAATGIAFFAPNTDDIFRAAERYTDRADSKVEGRLWQPSPAWAVFTAVALAVCILNLSSLSEFLYFKF